MLATAITLDAELPWITMAAGFVALYIINRKAMVGAAVGYLKDTNQVLHTQNQELKKERQVLVSKVSALETKTDFVMATRPMFEWMEKHEHLEAQRFDSLMTVLDMIAQKLGGETEPNDAKW